MIDGDARLYGMVTADGHFRVNNRRDSFTLRTWLAGQGVAEAHSLYVKPESIAAADPDWRCDSLGCLYTRHDQTIALVKDPRALAEDCPLSGAIVSTVPLRRNCPQVDVRIDWFDLWRNGAHALWINDDGKITVRSVAQDRGQRLWSPARQKGSKFTRTAENNKKRSAVRHQ